MFKFKPLNRKFSEVFAVVSLTLFLPICLEQYARDNGFLLPDRTVPCSAQVDHVPQQPTVPSINNISIPTPDEVRCVVKLAWLWVDTASFRCVLADC
jgi:UMF1 family MFS transporter